MSPSRRTALIGGIWFAITFIASIPALLLYDPVLTHRYILGAGSITRIEFGALLEVILALSGIATAVVFYPALKRQNEAVALGYVASRTVESIMYSGRCHLRYVRCHPAAGHRWCRRG